MNSQGLQRLDALPPIPLVVHEILQALSAPDIGLNNIARALSREPGLSGRLIGAANAAFFSGQRPVYSVQDALVRLGLNRVRVIATSIMLGARFNARRCPAFNAQAYWCQAMKTADCASRLAQWVPVETAKEAAYLAGLLHNIGLLANAYSFPNEMDAVLREASATGEHLSEVERRVLGFDHHEVGAELLSRWRLPLEIVTAVRQLPDADFAGDYARLAQVVRIAAEWAASGFRSLPAGTAQLRGVEEAKLQRLGESCRREANQFESFATMLSVAA